MTSDGDINPTGTSDGDINPTGTSDGGINPIVISDGDIDMKARVRSKSPHKRSRDALDSSDNEASEESAPQFTKRTKDDTYEDKVSVSKSIPSSW